MITRRTQWVNIFHWKVWSFLMQSLVWFIDIFNTTTLYLTTCTLAGRSFKYWEFYRHPLSTSLGFSPARHPRGMKSSYTFKNPEEKLNFVASYLITLLGNQILKGKIVLQESVAINWENKIIRTKKNTKKQKNNQLTNKQRKRRISTDKLSHAKETQDAIFALTVSVLLKIVFNGIINQITQADIHWYNLIVSN